MKIIKKILLLVLIIFSVVAISLHCLKIYVVKKINTNIEQENYKTEIIKHNKIMYEIGNIEKYPILKISKDKGKKWQTINVRGFFWDSFPTNSHYSGLKTINNTIWFYEYETSIESDGGNKLHNIFYSHDNGITWDKINSFKYIQQDMFFEFQNDDVGYLTLFTDENIDKKYKTNNGGNTWTLINKIN